MNSPSLRGLLLACVVPALVHAQSTWVGGNGGNAFSNSANWSPASVPATNADLVFNTTTNTSVSFNTLPYTADSLTFGSTATNQFFLNGNGGTLTIGAGGVTTIAGNGGVTFNSPMSLALGANQTWTTASTVTVFSNLSGAFSLTKSGSGSLILNGTNSYSGGTTVTAGALYLSNNNNSAGSFNIGANGTLGTGNSDVTLGSGNAVTLASGATLGGSPTNSGGQNKLELDGTVTVASTAHTLNLGNNAQVMLAGSVTATAGTALTIHGDGTGLAIMTGSQSNINTMTADNSALVFANVAALPTLSSNSITALNGGYVSIATVSGGPTPPTVSALLGMIDRSTFNGTLGFDTPDHSSSPIVYSSNIDLTGFTAGNVRLGSISSAVLTGTITPVAQSYDFGGYASGGGVLIVQSALVDHGGTTGLSLVSPAASGGAAQNGMILGLQGTNTFSGNISVSNSSLLLDSAGALPGTASISLGANSYSGYTEATGFANFAAFASRISSSTATSILGLDSHDALDAFVNGGTGTAVNTVNGVDLSGFSSIYLGTLTTAIVNGTLVAPSDGTVRLVNLNQAGDLTINSTLSNSNGLVAGMAGSSGTVVLNGNNTYTGGTTLLGGGLLAGSNSALGGGAITVTNPGNNNVFLGATTNGITLANDIAITGQFSIGSGGLDKSGSTFTADTNAITLNGVISGTGQLSITTPTTLSGTNTYTGGTYVEANTTVTNNHGLGTSFVDLGYNAVLTFDTAHPVIGVLADAGSFNFGAGTGNINLTSSVLDLTINQPSNQSFSGQFTGTSANLIKNGGGQLTLLGDNAAHIASATLNAGSLAIGDGNSTTATFGGNVSAASGTTLVFRPGSNQTMAYGGTITGAGGVTVNGSGSSATVNVTGGSSNFTGNTFVNSGTLRLNGDNLWSNASAVSVSGGATLRLDGNQTIENLSGGGTVNLATTGKTMTVNSASNTTFAGSINGTGSVTKTNSNTLTLTGNNGFTGTLTVSAGTVQLGSGGGSGSLASAVSVGSGATFKINRSGAVSFVSGISGAGGLTTATGTITLTNNDTYTGATTVSSGTLKLGATGAISSSSQINVAGGATFDVSSVNNGFSLVSGQTITGTGFVTGPFTAATGSQIAPGAPTGNLSFSSGLTFNTGSILDFGLGSSSSQIAVTSGLLAGPSGTGGITVNLTDSGGFGANTYNLINFTGATLSGLDLTDFTLGTKISGYNYSFGFNGTFLQLMATTIAVPEPSTYAALLALAAAGFTLWRRRRRA